MLSMLLAMLETEEDRERFLKLHGTYEKKLYAVAVRVLGDRTAAEDAVQQTWLQLIRRWDRVSGLAWSETEGYLVTAVKNTASGRSCAVLSKISIMNGSWNSLGAIS